MHRLNAGCGEYHVQGWVNMDLHLNGPSADVVGSLLDIPLDTDSCSHVYCGHVLEHIKPDDLPHALQEIRRVLSPEGELLVVGPDMDKAKDIAPEVVPTIESGEDRWVGDQHQWISTLDATLAYLHDWTDWRTHVIPIGYVPDSWPVVSRAPWQFAVLVR